MTKRSAMSKVDETQAAPRVRRTRTHAAAPAPAPPPENVTNRTPSPPSVKEIGGSGILIWDLGTINRVSMTSPKFLTDGEDHTKQMAAIALRAFKPTDTIEGMIAAQAVALHYASLECSRRAMVEGQPIDIAARLRRDAANSARAMIDMCEALDRRRGKGPQIVRVERVVVNEGGQAVVGNVTSGASLPSSVPSPQAIGQGANPISMVEGAPIMTREGEGV